MRVYLAVPPLEGKLKQILGTGGPPLGISYIAAVLERAGHIVRLFDGGLPGNMWNNFIEDIKKFKPDVVGLSAMTAVINNAYKAASLIKKISKKVVTVVGGPHAMFAPRETLEECPDLDVVVKGEGEEISLNLINTLEKNGDLSEVKGIVWRNEDEIVSNPSAALIKDIDEIPFPAYHLWDMKRYAAKKNLPIGTMMTSRGCPYRCAYCSSSRIFGKVWRARSAKNVVEELKLLVGKYGRKYVAFLDDIFTLSKSRAMEIADRIKVEKMGIKWDCSSRVDRMDEELAQKLKSAGCLRIYLGFESGSQHTLSLINKRITLEQSRETAKMLKKMNFEIIGSFMMGIPGETREDIEATIDFAREVRPDYAQFTILTPYPGTPVYEEAVNGNRLLTRDWDRYGIVSSVMKIPGFTAKELNALLRKAYIKFYLSPSFWLQQIKKKRMWFFGRVFRAFFH